MFEPLWFWYNLLMQKTIFIFRGAPASGKKTITEEFVKRIKGEVAFFELDKFRWGFHNVNRNIEEITNDEHQFAYENYLAVLENYLRNGTYTIVTEGSFSWDSSSPHGNVQDILKIANQYDYSIKNILLYAEKDILWERNLKRDYVVPKDEFDVLYENVMQKESKKEERVDVGKNTIEESVSFLELKFL